MSAAEVTKPGPRGEPGVGQVLAVEPGDRGGDRDDRRPAGHLLRDDVEPVALQGQVGLHDRRHQVAQRLRPLGGAQHVVVDVLEVRQHRRRGRSPGRGAAECSRTSRIGSTTRRSVTRLLRSAKLRALHVLVARPVVEQQVLQALDLARPAPATASKCPSTTSSSSPYSRNATPFPARSWPRVPPGHHGVHVERGVLADRHQRARGDEGGDLAQAQLPAGRGPGSDRVDVEELVRLVPVELGPLPAGDARPPPPACAAPARPRPRPGPPVRGAQVHPYGRLGSSR